MARTRSLHGFDVSLARPVWGGDDESRDFIQDLRLSTFCACGSHSLRQEEIFKSELFKFKIGAQEEEIFVHSQAVARLSPALAALIHGPLRESEEKVVKWDDLGTGDFIRFTQFAYTGDYCAPSSTPENVNPDTCKSDVDGTSNETTQNKHLPVTVNDPPPPEEGADLAIWWPPAQTKSPKEEKSPQAKFQRMLFPENRTWNDPDTLNRLVCNKLGEDFTPVLLGHARQYVLGNKYGIAELSALALHKLYKTMTLFKMTAARINDVVALIRYTYENTQDSANDPLRRMIIRWVASEIQCIGKTVEFQQLLEEGGDFAGEFWKNILRYLP